MKIFILLLVFYCSGSNGDISEKLRQGQGLRPNSQSSNFPGLQPPFASNLKGGSNVKGGSNIKGAAQPSETNRGIFLPHHHDGDDENNLERLCNDPFHSFLCKPVGPRKYRIDGNLRPGAVLPPGLSVASSNLRENKQPLQSGSALLADSIPNGNGYNYPRPSNIVENLQKPGYSYPRPSNIVENLQKPGYSYPRPSDNQLVLPSNVNSQGYRYPSPPNQLGFTSQKNTTKAPRPTYAPPTRPQSFLINVPLPSQTQQVLRPAIQNGYQYPKPSNQIQVSLGTSPAPTTTFKPKNEYLPPFGSQPQQSNNFNQAVPINTPRPIISTPRPIFTTRPTQRPTNEYLPPFGSQPQQSNNFNQALPFNSPRSSTPSPVITTRRPITTTRPTKKPNNDYLPPFGFQPQQSNNFNQALLFNTPRPVITTPRPIVTTRPTQRPNNEYLPPFGYQPQQTNNFNQALSFSTPRPTTPRPAITTPKPTIPTQKPFGFQSQQSNNFNQVLPVNRPRPTERPNNEYLPPIDIRVDGQSTNLSPNIEGGALLADQISPTNTNTKKERTHTLEELCNDAFHNFLCKPIDKPRKRIDGKIRPGAKIPPNVLQGAGSSQDGISSLPNQEGSALLPSSIENQNGYQYNLPSLPFQSTNLSPELLPYNPFFIASASDSSALAKNVQEQAKASNQQPTALTTSRPKTTGYSYLKPTKNPLTYPTTGYVYTKPPPNRRFTLPNFATTLPTFGSRIQPQEQAQEIIDDINTLNDDELPPASQFEILKP